MNIALALVAMLGALGPETSTALARGVAVAAAEDARFDVVSAIDLRSTERCEDDGTSGGEACVRKLATAYEARLVFFLRVYDISGETHAALTLLDLHGGGVIARHELVGDDRALFAAVKESARAALGAFTGHLEGERTRLFVSEPAVQSTALKRADLEARLTRLNDEVGAQTTWVAVAGGLVVAALAPAYVTHYAARLGHLDDRIAGLSALAGLAAAVPIIYFVTTPGIEQLTSLENRRDALAFELGSLEAEEAE